MRTWIPALLIGCMFAGTAAAETIVVDGQLQVVKCQSACPQRGTTMGQVEKRFGAPVKRFAAVDKPPITRWDYSSFSVYFEDNRVIHTVAHG